MHRGRWRLLIGGIVLGGLACGVLLWRPHSRPVNILLITLDTTRADRLGCYGYEPALTPALDRLAQQGVLFERAYATAPITLPSHASLFSGLYPPEHGVRTNGRGKFDAQIPTISSLLSQSKYDTGAFVASFVLDSKFGLDGGFSVYDDHIAAAEPSDDVLHRERNGAAVVKSALDWLKKPRSQPFCCWVHLYDPHAPYQLHEQEFGARFQGRPYDAEIAYVDRQIQRLLDYLRVSGRENNTLIVVVGDHGEGLGDHVEQNHGYTLYDSTQHVPLIFQWPGRIASGHRHPAPVSLVDVCPTICELLGLETPADISGRSFRAALQGKPFNAVNCYAATDDPLLQEGWAPLRSVTDERWKYIRTTKPELYDLQSDPSEKRNLAETEVERLAEMERLLTQMERSMQVRTSTNVQLSERERRVLESLGYLGNRGTTTTADPGEALIDVKDMLQHDVDARAALDLFHAGNAVQAAERLRAIIARSPGHAASRFFLGEVLESLDDLEGSLKSYESVLEIKPDHIDALVRMGNAHGRLGRLDQAIDYFDKALRCSPDSIQAQVNLGKALLYQGKFEEAASHLQEALQLDPELPGIRISLGEALRQAGRGAEAVPYLEEEIRRNPAGVPARMNLAAILADAQPDAAMQFLLEALQFQPRNPHIHFQIGELLLSQDQPAEAIQYLMETRRLMPDHPQASAELERARKLLKE